MTRDVPLHTLQMNIDESLKELREKLQARREEIDSLLSEQKELCNGEHWKNLNRPGANIFIYRAQRADSTAKVGSSAVRVGDANVPRLH